MGPVADFRQGFDPSHWEPIWEDFTCDWRELWFNQRVEPPSWLIGDEVIAAGAKGILFQSRLNVGGTNLTLYPVTPERRPARTSRCIQTTGHPV